MRRRHAPRQDGVHAPTVGEGRRPSDRQYASVCEVTRVQRAAKRLGAAIHFEREEESATHPNSTRGNATTMKTPVVDKSIMRLALITNLVATVVVAVSTRSPEAIAAVQAPLLTLLGGRALMR
jgi:hypothetical protein